ncbi:MAG: hypothetical protein HYV07_28685 [Deltaproteobacteria bacterium]|nr:hypothetical protein [Deltaproteobacteria bacterium]
MSRKMSEEDLLEHLHQALDEILTVIVSLDGLPTDEVPDGALDVALRSDESFCEAQDAFRDALKPVLALDERLGLNVEQVANALAARAAEVGFRLGTMVNRG